MNILSEQAEEILEFLWIEVKENKNIPDIKVLKDEDALQELIEHHYLDRNQETLLTKKGEKEARECVRRHRLAERLLTDILNVKDPLVHEASCKFEHVLHHGLEDNICTLLGHPKRCPHGKQIPYGKCCERLEKTPRRLITSLKELAVGQRARISYINTQDSEVLKKLIAMGILPGHEITLMHRFPSFVFAMGGSHFAIDTDLADNIHVLLLGK